jgi:hypothetical protein
MAFVRGFLNELVIYFTRCTLDERTRYIRVAYSFELGDGAVVSHQRIKARPDLLGK